MFEPETFIESLFEDTTQSTLIFDLIENIAALIPTLHSQLSAYLPNEIASSCTAFEENCILNPILLWATFDQRCFHIGFDLPCELNVLTDSKLLGTLHTSIIGDAHFILRSEGGTTIITSKTPPTTYDNYSPDHLQISNLSIDPDTIQFLQKPPKKAWWPF